jgi:hypothetical protein
MSWCSRVSGVFVTASPDSAELVYQAALDCFVSCLSSCAKRVALAKAIAVKLNLPQDLVSWADFVSLCSVAFAVCLTLFERPCFRVCVCVCVCVLDKIVALKHAYSL